MPTDAPIETDRAVDRVGPRQAVDDPLRKLATARPCRDGSGSTTSNSSPPRRPTWPSFADYVAQPQGDEPKQGIAGRVAERVVDRLEAVEVEQEHRAAVLAAHRADQRVVERPAKDLAVGQPGQRVLARKPVELDLRLPHLGEVGSEAAKAEEAAEFVMNRPARDRPPNLVLGLGADDQVLESDVRRQIEAKCPFRRRSAVGGLGRDQVREWALDQVGGLPAQRPCHAVADVGQDPVAGGFPEPAFFAVLEFLDEPFGARGLRARFFLGGTTAPRPQQSSNASHASSSSAECPRPMWFKFG